ncbi:major facilitator superfamily domain-containing protein [Truncatella angustata]|uniref:Major facilitator superfamily domain-containing protein n=1 Tax=Truncatella angustata TaxID=152316 RepID=A0A9P8RF53_9PEZI|nr:major facilitator superfamily domain-containing protein [Truncatella angustata]KAH6643452.1 major facilitator superfamily domain-containing protein [Truncatella angustata]
MPFLCACYTLNFIDKVLLNYAKIMGMESQLHLIGNNYSNASSAFFIAVLLFSFPNMWLLNRLPVAKCLGFNLLGWGLCSACHAALSNYGGLVTVRVLSGAFESGIPPALMLLSSQYFTYSEQAPRFAYWYMGMGNGQILGALISFGFQHMSPSAPLSSWKTMFLVLGLVTMMLGVIVLLFVPDSPMKARYLNNEEKVALLEHIKVNQTGIDSRHFHPRQLLEGLLDLGCWGIFFVIILQSSGSGVVTAYSATILTSFGYTPKQAALLNIPSGVVNIIVILSYSAFVRFRGQRWLVNAVAGAIGTMAAALLCFLPNSNRAGLLAGMYLINVLPGASNITFQWLTCNTGGHTKRTYATAGMSAAFAIGNIIGPLTFRAQDAPQFRPAKLTLVVMWGTSILASVLCFLYYSWMNKSRARGSGGTAEKVELSQAYAGLTDKENKDFSYHL